MITATQMHAEHEAIVVAHAKGRIAKTATKAMVKHLDRLNNRQATTFERALWMTLAAGQSEDEAHVVANRVQYLEDLRNEAHTEALAEAVERAVQAPAVRGS